MTITKTLSITKGRRNGIDVIRIEDTERNLDFGITQSEKQYDMWFEIYKACRYESENRENAFMRMYDKYTKELNEVGIYYNNSSLDELENSMSNDAKVLRGLESLLNFFKEFEFEPNFRFINTFSRKLQISAEDALDYVVNYFSLMDNTYTKEIKSKIESREFKMIINDLKSIPPKNVVNNRFKVYYGSAGTGKTTQAMVESEGRVTVCNSSMLPSDLMENFVFVEGKPSFEPSDLWKCMEEGRKITLDEINLLPFDSLRFLQGILDGKKEIDYKGHKILIKEGFEVIGTMNLNIGGNVFGLPEPLVDRTSEIKQFVLTANQLMKAIIE